MTYYVRSNTKRITLKLNVHKKLKKLLIEESHFFHPGPSVYFTLRFDLREGQSLIIISILTLPTNIIFTHRSPFKNKSGNRFSTVKSQ